MLSCKEVSLLLSKACDQDLAWRERLAVRLHLLYCRGCARFGKQLQFLRTAGRRFSGQMDFAQAIRLSEGARERIRASLRRE